MTDPKYRAKYQALWLSKAAGTLDLLKECQELTPPDEYGKPLALYKICHVAVGEHLARLKKAAGK